MALCKKATETINYYSDSNDVITKDKTYDKAYIEVVSVGGSKTAMEAIVVMYADPSKETEVWRKRYTFPLSVEDGATNVFKQAYEYIKKLPEYAGAKDC